MLDQAGRPSLPCRIRLADCALLHHTSQCSLHRSQCSCTTMHPAGQLKLALREGEQCRVILICAAVQPGCPAAPGRQQAPQSAQGAERGRSKKAKHLGANAALSTSLFMNLRRASAALRSALSFAFLPSRIFPSAAPESCSDLLGSSSLASSLLLLWTASDWPGHCRFLCWLKNQASAGLGRRAGTSSSEPCKARQICWSQPQEQLQKLAVLCCCWKAGPQQQVSPSACPHWSKGHLQQSCSQRQWLHCMSFSLISLSQHVLECVQPVSAAE